MTVHSRVLRGRASPTPDFLDPDAELAAKQRSERRAVRVGTYATGVFPRTACILRASVRLLAATAFAAAFSEKRRAKMCVRPLLETMNERSECIR